MTTSTHSPPLPLRLGEPQPVGALAVFPVLGPEPGLHYRTFADALGLGAFVKELDEGASVNELLVGNPTDLPVLLYEGEEVQGAQQDRTLDVSVLVPARSRTKVPVSCVEAGRWDGSRRDESFTPAPHAADPSLRLAKRHRANAARAAGGPARPDQGEVWREVAARAARHKADAPTGALRDTYRARFGEIETLLGALRPVEGQLGALAQVAGRPAALDVVSRPEAFASLAPRLYRGYLLDALDQPFADPDEVGAQRFLRAALAAPRATVATPGLGRGLIVSGGGIEGAGLVHDDELVQLSAFPADHPGPEAGRIGRPSRRRRRLG